MDSSILLTINDTTFGARRGTQMVCIRIKEAETDSSVLLIQRYSNGLTVNPNTCVFGLFFLIQ